MAEYIEREALRNALYEADVITMEGVKILNQFPAADVEQVRHGKWICESVGADVSYFVCSECRREIKRTNDYFYKPTKHIAAYFPYCHCGAKMDLGADDGQSD